MPAQAPLAFSYLPQKDRFNPPWNPDPSATSIARIPMPIWPHIDVVMTHGPPRYHLDRILMYPHFVGNVQHRSVPSNLQHSSQPDQQPVMSNQHATISSQQQPGQSNQQPALSNQPATSSQPTKSNQPATGNQQSVPNNQPAMSNQPTTSNQPALSTQPVASNQQFIISDQQPVTSNQQVVVSSQHSAANSRQLQSIPSNQQPTQSNQQPAISNQQPTATTHQRSASNTQQSANNTPQPTVNSTPQLLQTTPQQHLGPTYNQANQTTQATSHQTHAPMHQNIGCPHLFRALVSTRPQLHCFAHVHDSWGAEIIRWGIRPWSVSSTIGKRQHQAPPPAPVDGQGRRLGRQVNEVCVEGVEEVEWDAKVVREKGYAFVDRRAQSHGASTVVVNVGVRGHGGTAGSGGGSGNGERGGVGGVAGGHGSRIDWGAWVVDLELPVVPGPGPSLKSSPGRVR